VGVAGIPGSSGLCPGFSGGWGCGDYGEFGQFGGNSGGGCMAELINLTPEPSRLECL
jgi:hypothetical protein